MNGASARRARRRAISVLPTPVGPIIRMFFGVISPRSVLVDLLAAPAVAQRDRDGALGVALADDVAVELGDDLLGGHARFHPSSVSIDVVLVGVDADVAGDLERLLDDVRRRHLGVLAAARARPRCA